jgi:hypothetical protein
MVRMKLREGALPAQWAGSIAVLVACGLCAGVEVEVRWPRAGETIVASVTDGFRMDIMLDNIGRTRRNCGELLLSVVEGQQELFAGRAPDPRRAPCGRLLAGRAALCISLPLIHRQAPSARALAMSLRAR